MRKYIIISVICLLTLIIAVPTAFADIVGEWTGCNSYNQDFIFNGDGSFEAHYRNSLGRVVINGSYVANTGVTPNAVTLQLENWYVNGMPWLNHPTRDDVFNAIYSVTNDELRIAIPLYVGSDAPSQETLNNDGMCFKKAE